MLQAAQAVACRVTEGTEDGLVFLLDTAGEFLQPVVARHHLHRLYQDTVPTRTCTAPHSANIVHRPIGQMHASTLTGPVDLRSRYPQVSLQGFLNLFALRPQFTMQSAQRLVTILAHVAVGQEYGVHPRQQVRCRIQALRAGGQKRRAVFHVRPQLHADAQQQCEVAKGGAGQRRPGRRHLADGSPYIRQIREDWAFTGFQAQAGGGDGRLQLAGGHQRWGGGNIARGIGPERRCAEPFEQPADTLEFQGLEVSFHGYSW